MELIMVISVWSGEVPAKMKTRHPEMRVPIELNRRTVRCLHRGDSRVAVLWKNRTAFSKNCTAFSKNCTAFGKNSKQLIKAFKLTLYFF